MQLLATGIFFSVVFVAVNIQAELNLNGENVCPQRETYQETVIVEVRRPYTEIKTEKCWDVRQFFRCKKILTRYKYVKEPKVVHKTRIVPKCCAGYAVKKGELWPWAEDECSPVCSNGCIHGRCVAPDDCACHSGFYGSICQKVCPKNYWGKNCINKCDCSDNGDCDHISGECHCNLGWRGKSCELPCPDGFYGHDCEQKCDCDVCNHKTGECMTTTENVVVTLSSTVKEWTTEIPEEIYQSTKTSTINEGLLLKAITAKETISSETTSDASSVMVTWDESGSTKMSEEPSLEMITLKETTFPTESEGETNISKEEISVLETFITSNSTENIWVWTTTNETQKNLDKNEGHNFTSEKKKSFSDKRSLTLFHFLPSLSVISSVSFLIFIIAAKWIISKHRKKAGKTATMTGKEEKLFHSEEQIKFQAENFFWVNNCTKNPLPDIELNTTPILETFKPVTPNKGFISKEKEIK